jgi:hypothetical protein
MVSNHFPSLYISDSSGKQQKLSSILTTSHWFLSEQAMEASHSHLEGNKKFLQETCLDISFLFLWPWNVLYSMV